MLAVRRGRGGGEGHIVTESGGGPGRDLAAGRAGAGLGAARRAGGGIIAPLAGMLLGGIGRGQHEILRDILVAAPRALDKVERIVGRAVRNLGRGGVSAVVNSLGLQHRAVPVLEDDGVRFNLPHSVEHGVGVRGVGRALRVFGRGRVRIGRPAKEGIMLARRFGGGEGDISVIVFFLNVRRRAGAAVGVIRDGIDLFKTEGHVVGRGEIIILNREQIGLTGFELLLKAELVRLLAETRVAVIVAGVREVCAGVIGFGFVVHAVGIHSAQTVAEIGLCDGRRELIKRDLALRADLCSIGSIRHKHRRVRRIPKGVIGRIGGRNGDRIRCHIRFCFLAVLRGGPRDELVLRAGKAGFIQPDALPLRERLRKGRSAAGGVEGDVSAVCQNDGIVAGRTVVVMPRAEVILGPGVERLYDIMPVPRQIQQGLRLRRAVGAAGNVVLIGDLIPRAVDDIPLGVAVGALRLKDIGPGSGRREGEPRAGGPGGKARGGLGVKRDRGHGVRDRLDGVGGVIDIRLRIGGVAVVKIRKDRRRGIQRRIQRGGIGRRDLVDLLAPLIPRAQGVGTHLIRAGGLEEQENIVAAGGSVHIGGGTDVAAGVAGALDRRPPALR